MTASEYRQLLTDTLNRLDMAAVDAMVECFADAHARGATIFTMGNGGSGASASHAAGDFLKGASYGLDQRFKMVCLNDNLPSMMAIANDIGWEDIFVEPLKNFIQPGDVVIGISGSGNSKNVLKAVDYAKSKGATVIGEDVHMAVFNMVKKVMMARLMGDTPSMGGTYDARVQ
ncbi:MAG: SIS domain-containing protein [Flavobacteriia bacterium]|nr:SIS domain-containing protein [Flavobacteriia bacterium]